MIRQKKNQGAANLKRKIISKELEEVNKKKLRLKESVEELVKDFDKLAFEAADKSDFKIDPTICGWSLQGKKGDSRTRRNAKVPYSPQGFDSLI